MATTASTLNSLSIADSADLALRIFDDAVKVSERDARPMYKTVLTVLSSIEERSGVDLQVARNAVNSASSFHFLGTVGPQSRTILGDQLAQVA